jgi:hypothetical protein
MHRTFASSAFLAAVIVAMAAPLRADGGPQSKPAGQPPNPTAAATVCSKPAAQLAKESTRIYIAQRNGKDGAGSSWSDARDGSTAEAFDRILRCYSEGCADAGQKKPVARTENLIVCLGPGTFSTLGNSDYIIGVPHKSQQGFTLGKGWKLQGAGQDKTTVKLADYVANTRERNPLNFPDNTGSGLVFGTNSDSASSIEISSLTIDANYPELKARARQNGITALTLEAIHLRSDQGGHWIHDVKIVNAAGEIGGINMKWEAFPVWIVSINNPSPTQSGGNRIERVTMSQSFGETGCAIAIANAVAEVRDSVVTGYPIGFGGWKMEQVYFHNNTAIDTQYGFNIDSLPNKAVRIEGNKIIHPGKYGIVVGGDAAFSGFRIADNEVRINRSGVIGLLFRGNVTGAAVINNSFAAENASGAKSIAIQSAALRGSNGPSRDNLFESNRLAAGMKMVFQPSSDKARNCFFHNVDESGAPRRDLADNHNGSCLPEGAPEPRP